ncbi:MAG: uroporphyrinogen decarboxylase family protein [Bacillota bacterium]
MKPIDRIRKMSADQPIDRIPFVPTLYEHCAALINKTPSQVARSKDLIVAAQLKGYEVYEHDLISVGIDIYNIEVEALGGSIVYPENTDIPGLTNHILEDTEVLTSLKVPDPESDGRMPLILDAAENIKKEVGSEVLVNGTIVGPFTLAALLRGFEKLIMDMMLNPCYARELLGFAVKVCLKYGEAMVKRGLGLSINESWIAPPLLSPRLFREQVFPWEQYLINELKAKGLANVGLISGGNTTPIVDDMLKTGTSLIMADYNCDLAYFKTKADQAGVVLRGCIDSKLLERGSKEMIYDAVNRVLDVGVSNGKFVIGCGVVSYTTPKEQVLLFKQAVMDYFKMN